MTCADFTALILSYAYAASLLIGMERIGKHRGWSPFIIRKLIHIGAGMWVWPTLLLYDHWYIGIIPFFTFIFLNYLFYKKKTFSLMEASDPSLGTVYFAFSITVLFLLFWRDNPKTRYLPIATAATMVMTWGDAFAAIVGYKFGKHSFTIFGHKKTAEGSSAFFIISVAALGITLFLSSLYSTASYNTDKIVLSSIAASTAATLAEAVSPFGTDNLFVPFISAFVLFLIL